MMKKLLFLVLAFLVCTFFCFPYDKDNLIIYLDYEVPSDLKFVFTEDTILALSIEEIKADGKILETFQDVRDIPISSINFEKTISNSGKIKKIWNKRNGYYIWNDGRGIFFLQNDEGFYYPQTNSYRFPMETKTLEIKYRVMLPKNSINEKFLEKGLLEEVVYTSIYTKKIELK